MKKNSLSTKILVLALIVVFLGAGLIMFLSRYAVTGPAQNTSEISFVNNQNANWSTPQKASEQTMYGTLSGEKITATATSASAMVEPYEDKQALAAAGYTSDLNLAAGGPGSSVWGYKRMVNGKKQVIIYSYQTQPTSNNPNEPLQFNCPCKVGLSVFVSDPFNDKQ